MARRNFVSAGGQALVQTAVLFFLYRFVLETIGARGLGVWSLVLATVSAARLSEFGLSASVTKFVATHRANGRLDLADEAGQTAALTLAVCFGLGALLLYPLLVNLIPVVVPGEGTEDALALLPFALVSLWLSTVSGTWMGGLDGCLRTDLRAALMVIGTFAFLGISLLLVPSLGVVGLALGQVSQGVILLVGGWVSFRSVVGTPAILPVRWSSARFREMIGYGVAFQFNSLLYMLIDPITKLLVGHFGGLDVAGFFEMAQKLIIKARGLLVEVNRVVVPIFASLQASGDDSWLLYQRNTRYITVAVVTGTSFLAVGFPSLSLVWLGYHESVFVTLGYLLLPGYLINTLTVVPYFAFLGEGRLRWVVLGIGTMAALNISLGWVFGSLFGWRGVVIAFATALSVGSLVTFQAYHRQRGWVLRDLLSKADVILAAACVLAVAISVSITPFARARLGESGSLVVGGAAGVLVAALSSQHPLGKELGRRLVRRLRVVVSG